MTTDDLLKAICRHDSRPIFQNPWAIVVDGVTYSAATDGMRALFIADGRSPYTEPPLTDVLEKLLRTSQGYENENAQVLNRADLLAIVGEGEPADWGIPCLDCRGGIYRACERDCDTCAGRGVIIGANSYSPRRTAQMRIKAGGRYALIGTQLLRGLIANLPGDPIRVVIGTQSECYFSGVGWTLGVAGMSHPGPCALSIEAMPLPCGDNGGREALER